MGGLRPAEAVRRRAGAPRLGAVPRRRRARVAASSPRRSRALFARGAPAAPAYAIARRNRFLGRWLAHGEGYPDWNVRLFDRRRARWTDDPVHEHVVADGAGRAARRRSAARVGRIDRRLHRQAEPLHDAAGARRCTRAASARARCAHRAVAARALPALLRAEAAAFSTARPGFAHIAIGAFASFLKYAKLRALERATREPMTHPRVERSARARDRRGRLHRHAHGARAARRTARSVTGVDNFDPYYDVRAQGGARSRRSPTDRGFAFERLDLADADATARLFRDGALHARRASRRAAGRALFADASATRTCATTSPRSATCSKAAATRASRISSTRRARRCTARITRCRSPRTSRSTIR